MRFLAIGISEANNYYYTIKRCNMKQASLEILLHEINLLEMFRYSKNIK